ncbi:alpha/beta fold hydrolase [Aquipseudomonas ullengensis]|uniref:Alpha/beta hydrolase n=1 Tax=Aquipseudomonas ullengensis TaxID=2759166 RepID=A0A7W4LP28_9GAMM|nr:alpha/beta hydrolase [Pseudomonas ullengensis]MBB2496597.1 alpha/beta hydrolase [Pseudomonas ullengensis]
MSYFERDGCQLHYEDRGQGEPVLLVHGLGSSIQDWEFQIPELVRTRRVLAIDVRGHGRSGKPHTRYQMTDFSADVAGLIEHLGLSQVHLVGISMGGMIAFQLGVDRPELLKSLTIVNSAPEVIARTLSERWQLTKRKVLSRVLSLETIGKGLGRILFPRPEQAPLRQKIEQRWAENDKPAYLASLDAILGWGVRERLAAITCPTLVVSADRDYTPVAHKEAYVRELSNAQLVVIEQSRHATPMDQPERFNTALIAFLDQVELTCQPATKEPQPC